MYQLGEYVADYHFESGGTYRILITHAGNNHEVNIRVPNELTITSTDPTVFDRTAPFRVNWAMQGNTHVQGVEWETSWREGFSWGIEHGIMNIPSNARHFIIPADTITRNFHDGWMYIDAANYETSGKAIFVALSYGTVDLIR
jgi:hypothetical protein